MLICALRSPMLICALCAPAAGAWRSVQKSALTSSFGASKSGKRPTTRQSMVMPADQMSIAGPCAGHVISTSGARKPRVPSRAARGVRIPARSVVRAFRSPTSSCNCSRGIDAEAARSALDCFTWDSISPACFAPEAARSCGCDAPPARGGRGCFTLESISPACLAPDTARSVRESANGPVSRAPFRKPVSCWRLAAFKPGPAAARPMRI
jgi:hypothetical protein